MRDGTSIGRSQTAEKLLWRLVLLLALVSAGVLLLAAPAGAATLTYELSQSSIVYGGSVNLQGAAAPTLEGEVVEGLEVAVAVDGADVGTVLTDAAGAFAVALVPQRNCVVTARLAADGTGGPELPLVVKPAATTAFAAPVPFLRTKLTLKVQPTDYDGLAVARVTHRGRVVGTVKVRVRDGRAILRVPTPGIEWFRVQLTLEATQSFGRRELSRSFKVPYRTLRVGSSGAIVRGLLTRVASLRIRVPAVGTTLTSKSADAVVAFQKTYGLSRDYVVGYADWRKLEVAKRPRPRYARPAIHLEVDKTRQILMVVKDGKVWGLIPVSTGATGNTPTGSFRLYSHHPYTTSFYGGILWRTMGFYGEMAIHGYPSVPPYPASHGCIREPWWVADWVWDRSFVGERLYIFL
jgi:hypothetical protein